MAIDLELLEKRIDKWLESETEESIREWLLAHRKKLETSDEALTIPVVSGSYIWLVEDCDGSCILSAHLTEEEAEKEREKLSSGYAPSVDFRVYSVQIS